MVSFKFIDSLFMSHHSLTCCSSKFICGSNDFISFAEANKLVSSANILNERNSEKVGKSLMYITNRKGSNELP